MFILERLTGVGVYSLLLFLFCFSLVDKDYKKIRVRLFFYTVALSVLAYFYIPYETADLFRINEFIVIFKKYTFIEIWEKQVLVSELGFSTLLYWIIAKIGIIPLLPASVTFVCYSCIFYVIRRTAEIKKLPGKIVATTLFFYMSIGTYMFVISGIRCMLGISLLIFCFFRESVEKKFNVLHIPIYVLACLFHPFAAVLVAARFIVPVLDSKATPTKKVIYFTLLTVGAIIVLRRFSGFVEKIVEKAESYLSGDLYSYLWEYLIAALTCLIIFVVLSKRQVLKAETNLKLNVWIIYEIALFVVSLVLSFEFTIFHRMTTYIMPIIALPLMMTALQESDSRKSNRNKKAISLSHTPLDLNSGVLILSAMILMLACVRGSLSSFKFFVL